MTHQINKIILVDDDEDDRLVFSMALNTLGVHYELLLFEDGQKLMAYMEEKGRELSSIIFLDLNMPTISGIECLRLLRDNLKLKDSFVTIYSTSSSEKDVSAAYKNGAHGYLKKPSCFNRLQNLLNKAINVGVLNKGKQLPKEQFLITEQ